MAGGSIVWKRSRSDSGLGRKSALERLDGFESDEPCRGIAFPDRDEIGVSAYLTGKDLVETVAHELRHIANVSRGLEREADQRDATEYGRAYASRFAARFAV